MQDIDSFLIPQSEIHSLNVFLTNGCLNGKCSFCNFKDENEYCENSISSIISQIDNLIEENGTYRRAFLLYEDAINLSDSFLFEIIDYLKMTNPFLKKISIAAKTSGIIDRGVEGLKRLKEKGVNRIYQNIISGSNEILQDIGVTVTNEEQHQAAQIVKDARLELAQTIALGTAENDDLQMNAYITSKHLSNMNPDYINAIDLTGNIKTRFNKNFSNKGYDVTNDIREEMITILENLESEKTVFSSIAKNNDLCHLIHLPNQKNYIISVLEDLRPNKLSPVAAQ